MTKTMTKHDKIFFCRLFCYAMDFFGIKAKSLCNAADDEFTESSVSSWRTRNPPGAEIEFQSLVKAVKICLDNKHAGDYYDKKKYVEDLKSIISDYHCTIPEFIVKWTDYSIIDLAVRTIEFAYSQPRLISNKVISKTETLTVHGVSRSYARTEAVVFDFDGTLTTTNKVRTTWESIWTMLGYSVDECINLHLKFSNGEITHEQWCLFTEEKFKAKHLHRDQLVPLIESTQLIQDIDKVFLELDRRGIQVYIVSGSIKYIIRRCLAGLVEYVSGGIDANTFDFDEDGYLSHIIGTAYDFEGKAARITNIATDMKIDPNQILFIGNSLNDEWAHTSGARTLAINPKNTNMFNKAIWDDCIVHCESLLEILKFI